MKALLYDSKDSRWGIKDISTPTSRSNKELIIKTLHCGICGSDLHRIFSPQEDQERIVLGHEIVGKTEDNKIVVVNPIQNCGKCQLCVNGQSQFCKESINIGKNVNGGYSEFVSVYQSNIYDISDFTYPHVATLTDSIAVVIHALNKLQFPIKNQHILITGDGTIAGVIAAILNIIAPNAHVYLKGKNPKNFHLLAENYNTKEFLPNGAKGNFDVCFETVGRAQDDTLSVCIENSSYGGEILVLGVYPEGFLSQIPLRNIFYKEIRLIGVNSFVKSNKTDNFGEAVSLLRNHSEVFLPLITHSYKLEDVNKALQTIGNKGTEPVLKVLFTLD